MKPVWSIFTRRKSGKEANMAEQNPATPPAASGGLTEVQAKALFGDLLKDSLKDITSTVRSLADNQKILADTIAKQPAPADSKGPQKEEGNKGLTAEDVARILDDRDQKRSQDARVKAAKAKVIKERLNGLEDLGLSLPDTADESELTKAADAIANRLNSVLKPATNIGGASKDGGQPVTQQPIDKSKLSPVERIKMGLAENKGQ